MCLSNLKKFRVNPKRLYKVFAVTHSGDIFSPIFNDVGSPAIPKNEWIDEVDYRKYCFRKRYEIKSDIAFNYPFGFHSYARKKDALEYNSDVYEKYVVHRVEAKEIVAKGEQSPYWPTQNTKPRPIVVHKKMKVCEVVT